MSYNCQSTSSISVPMFADGACGAGCCNALMVSCDACIAASVADILGSFLCRGENSTVPMILSALFFGVYTR